MEAKDVGKTQSVHTGEVVRIRKSNSLVSAKYSNSLLGNQVIAMSLAGLEYDSSSGQLSSRVSVKDLCQLLGKRTADPNMYRRIKVLSNDLVHHAITIDFIDDAGRPAFETIPMFSRIAYENGCLSLEFSKYLTKELYDLKKNYTSFELATIMTFEKDYTLRLYELLKKDSWKLKENPAATVTVEYDVYELRAILGLIDTNLGYIATAVRNKESWENICENILKDEDKKFAKFVDLRRRVLDPAQVEIAMKSEIAFTYKPVRLGRGGKVVSIVFYITTNPNRNGLGSIPTPDIDKLPIIEEEAEETIVDQAQDPVAEAFYEVKNFMEDLGLVIEEFDLAFFRSLYKDAGGDVQLIKEEISHSLQVAEIRNYCGFLRSAVRKRYSQSAVVVVEGERQDVKVETGSRPTYTEANLERAWDLFRKKEWIPAFVESCGCLSVEEFEGIVEGVDLRLQASVSYLRGEYDSEVLESVREKVWDSFKGSEVFEEFVASFQEYAVVEVIEALHTSQERLRMFVQFRKARG